MLGKRQSGKPQEDDSSGDPQVTNCQLTEILVLCDQNVQLPRRQVEDLVVSVAKQFKVHEMNIIAIGQQPLEYGMRNVFVSEKCH